MRELVVARYREDLAWILPLLEHFDRVTVYNKGPALANLDPKIEVVKMANVGREGHTYLSHIIARMDPPNSLADETVFCQGDPIEHNDNFVADAAVPATHEFKTLSKIYKEGRPKKPLDSAGPYTLDSRTLQLKDPNEFDYGVQNFSRIATEDIAKTGDNLGGRSLAEYVCDLCGVPRPNDDICFTYSAQFAVKKDLILSHPVDVYKCLLKWLLQIKDYGGSQGYVLERLWQHIIRSRSDSNAVCLSRRGAAGPSGTQVTLDRFGERYFRIGS
jgi:hypothetical protein